MIAAWMLYATLVSFLFLVAAVALEKSLRLALRPGRWVVAVAMAVSAVVPFVTRSESFSSGAVGDGSGLLSTQGSLAALAEILPRSGALSLLRAHAPASRWR